jgi:hypothetical protein
MTESPIRSPISAAIRSPLDAARGSVGGGGPPAGDPALLLESGDTLLLESGDRLLLE